MKCLFHKWENVGVDYNRTYKGTYLRKIRRKKCGKEKFLFQDEKPNYPDAEDFVVIDSDFTKLLKQGASK